MNLFPVRLPRLLIAAFAFAAGAHAGEPPILAKARAYLGTEAALNAVKAVHYTGTVVSSDSADPTKQPQAQLEVIAQKPDQQRVVGTTEQAVETTALDGYEGWQRIHEPANPKKQRLVVFKPEAVKRLRAQAAENLSFFRGIEQQGGRTEDQGTATVDGIVCQKIAFIYAPTIIFYRYFDPATGRLVNTETEDGGTTREEGETIVNGVRFPKRMLMTLKGPKGTTRNVVVTLEKVVLNEVFPASLFRMPSPVAE